jgi:hypothetical protein
MLVFCLALFHADAHAWQVRNNDHGQELRWKNRTIPYQIDPSNTEGLSDAAVMSMIAASTRNWTTPVGDGLAFVDEGQTNGILDPHDGKNIIFFEDAWTHDPTLVGLTYVWSRPDGEIIGFDMALNTQDHDWSIDGTVGANDLLNTLSHEFGHALGVDHSPEVESATMYPSTFPGEVSKRDLDTDDESAVQYLYTGNDHSSMAPSAGCSIVNSRAHLTWILALPLLFTRRR